MNNKTRISYTLCGAVVPFLCASVSAEEVATPGMEVSDKILLMETINVTSNKEIADEDERSGDPEVDQVLKLVDSVTLSPDESADESASAETEELSDSESDEVNVQSTNFEQNKDELTQAVSDPAAAQKIDSETASSQNAEETE